MTRLYRIATLTMVFVTAFCLPATGIEPEKKGQDDIYRHLRLFGEALERTRNHYVDPIDEEALIHAAINGMLQSLDPHSAFLDPRAFNDIKLQTSGEFGGLGIEVTMEDGLVKVVSPLDDTPAARAGIKSGDRISEIDDMPVFGLTLSEAVERMRGLPGTDINLLILRDGENPKPVTMTREVIKISPVKAHLDGNVGIIRITIFNEKTTAKVKAAIQEFHTTIAQNNARSDSARSGKKGKGGNVSSIAPPAGPSDKGQRARADRNTLQGLVLDLRNTPGGLLEQAIAVSDAFLERGEIVSTRGRKNEDAQRFNARPGDLIHGLPIVVLINGGSASASEIVAGALQDHRRAIVIGEQSFGKGSVQTIINLNGQTAMRLTTARYYSPSGQSIQRNGITPDIFVPEAQIVAADTSFTRREKDLHGALGAAKNAPLDQNKTKNTTATPSKNTDGQEPPQDDADNAKIDYQLLRGVDLVRALSIRDTPPSKSPSGPAS